MKNSYLKIIYPFLIVAFFFLAFGCGKSSSSQDSTSDSINSQALDSSSSKTENAPYQTTCANCGKNISGYGYKMISEGNCIPCEEENLTDCTFCSEACGIEKDKKTTNSYNKILNEHGYNSISNDKKNDNQSNSDCSFNSDNDVLSYLIGKTFTQQGGGIEIRFSTDGAVISGKEEYQWQTYKSLGGYKGYVKLASINPSHPDGTITLWVSCRENSITDGQIVLFYN